MNIGLKMNKQCFCVGKVYGCTCDARCRCECSCIRELAEDISESGNFEYTEKEAEVLLGRIQDVTDHPEKFITLEELEKRLKLKGIEPTEEDRQWAKETVTKMREKFNGISDDDLLQKVDVSEEDEGLDIGDACSHCGQEWTGTL